MENTRISIRHFGLEHSSEIENSSNAVEMIEAFMNVMMSAGWSRKTIESGIIEVAYIIAENDEPSGMTEDEEMDDGLKNLG